MRNNIIMHWTVHILFFMITTLKVASEMYVSYNTVIISMTESYSFQHMGIFECFASCLRKDCHWMVFYNTSKNKLKRNYTLNR